MSDTEPAGQIEAVWTATEGSAPMRERESVEAVPGGLAGDRYQRGTGYYSPFDVCEVTLIAGEALDTIRSSFGIDLADGRHRRNLVTRGVSLASLLDCRFRVGGAVLEGTRPRPPCAHVQEVAGEPDLAEALGDDRGGICADVVDPGTIRPDDEVVRLASTAPDPDSLAARIRDRYE